MRNAAEKLFMEALTKIPSIERSGIAHSNEYYEVLLDDTNLPKGERVEILTDVRQKTEEKIEILEEQSLKEAKEIAVYENEDNLVNAIEMRQKASFVYQVVWLSATIFAVITLVALVVLLNLGIHLGTYPMLMSLTCSMALSFLVARLLTNKAAIYHFEKEAFLANLNEKKQHLEETKSNILDLKRLGKFADKTLKLNYE